MTTPLLSVVVVGFDMARELPRTIQSLLPPYQTGLAPGDVQIIVADNGSTTPVRREDFPADADISVIRIDDGGTSPCRAINRAAALARADQIAVMVDGARMASPGLLSTALQAARTDARAFVATLGFHLGPKTQQVSVTEGYDRAEEDRLLASIDWPADGYRLFEVSALGESYRHGVLASPPETTFFVLHRDRFQALGGFDERFVSLGGGMANFDLYDRALADAAAPLVLLVGEGTFHQLHFGATTQAGGIRRAAPVGQGTLEQLYRAEYKAIRGVPPSHPDRSPLLFGRVTHPRVLPLFFPGT